MRPLIAKIKPASGFSRVAHVGLNILLALLVFALVRINFVQLAVALILLSKWRMFVVRPRFWLANIRANAVDIIVSFSLLLFMVHAGGQGQQWWQIVWTAVYALWLLVIKPKSNTFIVAGQALISLLFGLTALFIGLGEEALYYLVLLSALISYLSARHFFDSFDEPYAKLLSYLWAYFSGGLVWVLGHWLLFYGFMAQPTLLLVALGYAVAALYYLDHYGRLTRIAKLEILITSSAIVLAVMASLIMNVISTVQALFR